MIRILQLRRAALVAIAALIGAAGPTLGVAAPAGPAPLAKGWGRVVASGILSSVDRTHGRVQLAVSGTGTVDWFEGGTAWRQTPLTGIRTVRLLPATTLVDATAHALPLAGVRPGAFAILWGVASPNADMAGMILEVAAPSVGSVAALSAAAPQTGVVVGRAGSALEVLSGAGTRRTIVMTATTEVMAGGRTVAAGSIVPDDIVAVAGPMNSDGSIVATKVTIEFSAPNSARVSGPLEEVLTAVGGLVADGTMISTSADTYLLRSGSGVPLSQAAPGSLVVAYGIPVLDDATPVGLAARVIVLR